MAGHREGSDDCRGRRTRKRLTAGLAALLLGACAAPPPTPPAAGPAMPPAVSSPPAPAQPPAAASPTRPPPATPPVAVAPQAVPPTRADAVARYDRVAFASLPAASDADWIAAWPAFLQSCQALATHPAWKDPCTRAATVDRRAAAAIRGYYAAAFDAYRVRAVTPPESKANEVRDTGLVTGYYEPQLKGSRRSSPTYRVPIYRVPADLVAIDLAGTYPELAGLRLRGRMQNGKVVAYPSRGEIMRGNLLRGQELLWVDDPIDAFFLQVQGSGRVVLDDGGVTRLGYGDSNGHPYRSIGRWLVDQGELTIDQASMQGIKAWAARNPQRLSQLLEQNPSFVFFREVPLGDPSAGPKGALNVPLTPHASLAVDTRFIPLGVPILLRSSDPATGAAFVRPMMAQDSGSAIRGPLRFDYFWGFGADAGEKAGRQKHEGSAWMLAPKGVAPEALLKR
jgi:membrane-bound lytic murein transglycosylase A